MSDRRFRSVRIPIWQFAEPASSVRCLEESAHEARELLRRSECSWTRENFGVLVLNARNRIVGAEIVSVGTATATLVHPREVFRPAIALGAVSIVVFHNHPSGDPTPSSEDVELTSRLLRAGELLGIPVVDSIVVTPTVAQTIIGWRDR